MYNTEPGCSPNLKPTVAIVADCAGNVRKLRTLLDPIGYRACAFSTITTLCYSTMRPQATMICTSDVDILQAIRSRSERAHYGQIVVLSTNYSEQLIVETIYAGADYYFNLAESYTVLQARVQAALRVDSSRHSSDWVVPPFTFDASKKNIRVFNKVVELTPREYQFARYMIMNKNRVVSSEELLISVWGLPENVSTRRVDTSASRLRKKMFLDERTGWSLTNIRNKGLIMQNTGFEYRRNRDLIIDGFSESFSP